MFCSGCGTQIQSGLSYCNRCGRRVGDDLSGAGWAANPMTLTAIIAGVGFFMFMLVFRAFSRSEMPAGLIVPISFFYFAALSGICLMVMRYGARNNGSARNEKPLDTGELTPPAYLSPITTAQLHESRDMGIGSVTDATTRTLEEVPRERRYRSGNDD